MWMYPGPSCFDCSFSTKLDDVEINVWIRGILVHGANQNSSPSPCPLREGVISPWTISQPLRHRVPWVRRYADCTYQVLSALRPRPSPRDVGDEVESMCSQVIVVERLLHETLASVHQNIMRPIRVSLKREAKSCPHPNDFLHALLFLMCFVSTALVSEQRGCAYVAGGGDPGAGGGHRHRGRPCRSNACCRDFCPRSYYDARQRRPPC
jgi:hypothetical protein